MSLLIRRCPNCELHDLDRYGDCPGCGYEESLDSEAANYVDPDCKACGMPDELCGCETEAMQEEWESSLRESEYV